MVGVLVGHLDFVFLYPNNWLTKMDCFQNDLLVSGKSDNNSAQLTPTGHEAVQFALLLKAISLHVDNML